MFWWHVLMEEKDGQRERDKLNSQKKFDSPPYFVHVMKCEHGEKAHAHEGHNHQRLLMGLWHLICFPVTVKCHIMSCFQGSWFTEYSPSGPVSHGVGCFTVLTWIYPSWCKPSVDTVVLVGLLEKLPALGQEWLGGSDISSPLVQFLRALFLLTQGRKPLPALGGWKKKGQGADSQMYRLNRNRWKGRRKINFPFPFWISLWI